MNKKEETFFKIPTKEEAEIIVMSAYNENPSPWLDHCKVTARVAEKIASMCGLNTDRAYVSGLLHDIGYSKYLNGKGKSCHIYIGYELMKEKGYESIANICLSHSFFYQDIRAYGGSDMNCSEEEIKQIKNFLKNTIFDDYDKLIQLSDSLGPSQGVCIIEQRIVDVTKRHGFNDFTIKRWNSLMELKKYFDNKCGMNIYNLFKEEIGKYIFD